MRSGGKAETAGEQGAGSQRAEGKAKSGKAEIVKPGPENKAARGRAAAKYLELNFDR